MQQFFGGGGVGGGVGGGAGYKESVLWWIRKRSVI